MQWLCPLLKSHISLSKISGEARSEKRTSYNRTKYKKKQNLSKLYNYATIVHNQFVKLAILMDRT